MPTLTYPLRFQRHEVLKPWGGRRLLACPGIALEREGDVGETWEIVDRPNENPEVGGGPFAGWTLRALMEEHRRDLLGRAPPTPHGRFPLLVKYIDAQENLSVQVHPDEAAALAIRNGAEPKTEAWYFLGVERGGARASGQERLGRVYTGLKPECDRDRFARVAASRAVVDGLYAWDVEPGQCLLVPGGTVHAIGAGVTLLEVQQNSDTTYRIWDWDRVGADGVPRETHLAEALVAARFDLPRRPPVDPVWERASAALERAPLVRSSAFAMSVLRLSGRASFSTGDQFQIYAAVEGAGRLGVRSGGAEVELRQGDVWLVPAAAGEHEVEPARGSLTLVQIQSQA